MIKLSSTLWVGLGQARGLLAYPGRWASLVSVIFLAAGTALGLLGAYRLQAPVQRVDVGAPGDSGVLSLWGGSEQSEGGSFRWSSGTSALHLFGLEGRAALLQLRLSATRPPGEAEAALNLSSGERPLGAWPVSRGWRVYSLALPPQPGSEQTILLRSSTFDPGGRDGRSLGVALDTLAAAPLVLPTMRWPPTGRWLFLSLLPPLLALALRAFRFSLFPALLLALLLIVSVARFPVMIAYVLPTLWPTLALAVLALALPPARSWLRGQAPLTAGRSCLALGLALGLLGLSLVAWQYWLVGVPLAAVGSLLLALSYAPGQVAGQAAAQYRLAALALGAVTFLALVLRLWRLDVLPLGIWQDEARHGLAALRLLSDASYRPVYAPEVDLPALVFYAIAPSLAAFDVRTWSLRLPMALAGALLPLALFTLVRPLVGRGTALVAALLIGCASWSISLSRIAWPTIFDPLLLLLALALLWQSLHISRLWAALLLAALSGLLTGLDGYTYHTGRLAPLFCLWLLGCVWYQARHQAKASAPVSGSQVGGLRSRASGLGPQATGRAALVLLAWSAALLLALTPLLSYARSDPQGFGKRVGGVSLWSGTAVESGSPLTLLEGSALAYAGMFHLQGDPNGRHHLPNRPMLDPLTGLLFVLGLLWALHQRRELLARLLLGWLVLGLAAGVLSTGGVHAMRSVGALAPTLVLAAIGLREALRVLLPRHRLLAGGAVLTLVVLLNGYLYFWLLPSEPAHVRAFRPVATRMGLAARVIAGSPERPQVYLPVAQLGSDEARLFTEGMVNIGSVEGAVRPAPRAVLLLPGTVAPDQRDAALQRLGLRGARGVPGGFFPDSGEPLFWIYRRAP